MAVAPFGAQAEKHVRLLEPRDMAVADARQGKAEAAQPRAQKRNSRAAPGLHPCRQKRQLVGRTGAEQRMTPDHLRGSEARSEEHTSALQSLMRIPYAVFCLKKKTPQ